MTQSRRLAAIMVADVVGYSRMMEADEAGTLAALKERRRVVLEPVVKAHGGRIVKVMGDGVLVEFSSAVNAVQGALELQRKMAEGNRDMPEDRQIVLRIGINLGDVIGEGSDIYGDGVNVAARLEALAEPGGICVSRNVHEQVARRTDIAFEDLGDQQLKNISIPVRAYLTRLSNEGLRPAPSRLDKPSIAVLPFDNMSGEQDQAYFSDGITEDIITELSRFRDLVVAARNSSFTFKGHSVDVKEVGRKLGVRYVVEGSVRKANNRVRVTAQLIDAVSGNHLWAERYDRDIEDIFAVQDELVSSIAGSVPGWLQRQTMDQLRRKPPGNLTAYDCELRGRWAMGHWNEGLGSAIQWFEKSIKSDPDYGLAHAGLAMAYSYAVYVLGLDPEPTFNKAKVHSGRALVLDGDNPIVNAYATFCYHLSGEPRLAMVQSERAIALNPHDPFALYVRACALTYIGRQEEALDYYARSERLQSYAADDQRLDSLCDCYFMLGQYEKVLDIHQRYQNIPPFLYLVRAASFAHLGRMDEAKSAVEMYEQTRPPNQDYRDMVRSHQRMCAREQDRSRWLEGYRKAGLDV